jgi:mannose-6-phosphate isomerase-like protein (cupin superfamily)
MTCRIRNLIAGSVAAVLLGAPAVRAQPPAAAPSAAALNQFATSAEVAALMAKAKAERPDQALRSQPIVGFAPYTATLESRAAVAGAAAHDTEAELFYVVDRAGTMVTAGALTMETRPTANNRAGTGIQGGESRHVAKGDFMLVPPGVPHWFSAIDGALVLMSLHLPIR